MGGGILCVWTLGNVVFFTDALRRIQARTFRVIIWGTRLQIAYFTGESMKITGQICALEFS